MSNKLKIQISITELLHITDALSELNSCVTTQPERARVNILEQITVKLLKKQLTKRHEIKAFKIELEYYEAYYLERYLKEYNMHTNAHFIQTVIAKLNQKIA